MRKLAGVTARTHRWWSTSPLLVLDLRAEIGHELQHERGRVERVEPSELVRGVAHTAGAEQHDREERVHVGVRVVEHHRLTEIGQALRIAAREPDPPTVRERFDVARCVLEHARVTGDRIRGLGLCFVEAVDVALARRFRDLAGDRVARVATTGGSGDDDSTHEREHHDPRHDECRATARRRGPRRGKIGLALLDGARHRREPGLVVVLQRLVVVGLEVAGVVLALEVGQ